MSRERSGGLIVENDLGVRFNSNIKDGSKWLSKFLEDLDLVRYESEIKDLYLEFNRTTYNKHFGGKRNIFIGCAFVFCKKEGVPREINKFKGFIRNKYQFKQVYSYVGKVLDVRVLPFRVGDWVSRVINLLNRELDVSQYESIENMAIKLNERLEDSEIVGKSPKIIASNLVYLSSILVNGQQGKIIQKEISDVVGVSPGAISNNWGYLVKRLELDKHLYERGYNV